VGTEIPWVRRRMQWTAGGLESCPTRVHLMLFASGYLVVGTIAARQRLVPAPGTRRRQVYDSTFVVDCKRHSSEVKREIQMEGGAAVHGFSCRNHQDKCTAIVPFIPLGRPATLQELCAFVLI
jgi:hypothetical protein